MGHGPALIEPSRPTLASVLHDAGYATGRVRRVGTSGSAGIPGRLVREWFRSRRHAARQRRTDFGTDIDYTARSPAARPRSASTGSSASPARSTCRPTRSSTRPHRRHAGPGEGDYLTEQRPGLQVPGFREDEADVRFVAEALRWLDTVPTDQPFLCYVTPSAPHRPNVPPDVVRGRSVSVTAPTGSASSTGRSASWSTPSTPVVSATIRW